MLCVKARMGRMEEDELPAAVAKLRLKSQASTPYCQQRTCVIWEGANERQCIPVPVVSNCSNG